ncbi:MAG TPA: CotH kinase family protein [Verrucomicrobiae bacterium]|nr:CotH kinase family protein [Verrucomicrobiae bacterium]
MKSCLHSENPARAFGILGWTLLLLLSARVNAGTPGDDLIACTNVLRIAIEMDEVEMQALRAPRGDSEKARGRATVTEGDRRYTNVSVQLKGFTTYRSIDDRPSLTLKFDRHAAGQTFHGLTKISLNNSLQDPTRLNELVSRELFEAAGVPVPRASHALVTLNERDLGLYVLTEGYDEIFLARYFSRTGGTLYEGGTLQDIDSLPRSGSGAPGEDAALAQLLAAAREPNPEKRFRALSQILDMERFLSMTAMETILCHSDSYSMNRNNYRFYRDSATGRFVFMPHGMDRVLGTHRSGLDLSIVPPQLGMVTRAVLSTTRGRAQYLDRLGTLLTNVFRPVHVCARIGQVDGLIAPEKVRKRGIARSRAASSQVTGQDADDLCRRVEERFADLVLQFASLRSYLERPRFPVFDSNHVQILHDWVLRPSMDGRGSVLRCERKDGRTLLRVTSTNGPVAASLRNRLTLPAGRYRLAGEIIAPDAPEGTTVSLALNRWSGGRFQLRKTNLNRQSIDTPVGVAENSAPEEVELVCDIQSKAREFLLDISSLRLIEDRAFGSAGSPR